MLFWYYILFTSKIYFAKDKLIISIQKIVHWIGSNGFAESLSEMIQDVFRKSENRDFLVVDWFDDDDVVQEVILVPLELKSKRCNGREHKPVSSVSLQWSKINTITFSEDVVFVNCYLTSELQEITRKTETEERREKEIRHYTSRN